MLTNIQSDLPEWAAKIYPESKGWDRIRKKLAFSFVGVAASPSCAADVITG
ncbi:hypothetical protein NM432_13295 [Vibrio metschnikovii]